MKSSDRNFEIEAVQRVFRVARFGLYPFLSLVLFGCDGLSSMQKQSLTPFAKQNSAYTIQDLGVFGPNPSAPGGPLVVTDSGWISGAAGVGPGGTAPEHAVLYYQGKTIDVGTPGLGGNSMGYGANESGVTVGGAESTAAGLATTEDFCGFQFLGFSSTPTPCVPFIWQNGQMVPLPTLGGVNGSATEINSSGMVGGYAETTATDPNCTAPQKYQFKPVVWSDGKVRAFPTGNDTDGLVTAINDRGDAAGASGTCGPLNPILLLYLNPTHAWFWRNGAAIDLGNLGGANNNLPHGMNNLGQVVGESDLAGDQTAHAFLASPGTKMQDLGTVQDQVDNDTYSFGFGINDAGEIVGISANADFSVIRAFIRRNGALVDLNSLVSGNNSLYLLTACFVNSRGEITGIALDAAGQEHTYLAVPVAGASSTATPAVKVPVLPDSVREWFRSVRPI